MFTLLYNIYNTDTLVVDNSFPPIEIFQPCRETSCVRREIRQNKLENYLKETKYTRPCPPNKQ